ncbi:MAG: hypothetical protein HY046_13920 [Acidobacteria bacterium]|nr:hypothetical protein [Acidobacteriota bacterium]
MKFLILCLGCGARVEAELASNEEDLVGAGLLERHCVRCASMTRWGKAEDYRRVGERRKNERRTGRFRRRENRRVASREKPSDRRRSERRDGQYRRRDHRRSGS